MAANVWKDGFIIVRGSEEIKLTYEEISEIYRAIQATNGTGSIQYYLDCLYDDEDEEKAAIAEEMLNDDNLCRDIWVEYLDEVMYDSGDTEFDIVHDEVMRRLDDKRRSN